MRPRRTTISPSRGPALARAATAYRRAVLSGDEAGGEAAIRAALADGVSAPELYDDVITPAMYLVGDSWAAGELDVADEHLATALSERMITLIDAAATTTPRTERPRHALLASPEGELHVLGLRMAESGLRRAGHTVTMLGAAVPAGALATMALRRRPDVVGVSVTLHDGMAALSRMLQALREVAPQLPVLVGGAPRGAPPADARLYMVGSIGEALRLLDRADVITRP